MQHVASFPAPAELYWDPLWGLPQILILKSHWKIQFLRAHEYLDCSIAKLGECSTYRLLTWIYGST